MLSIRKIPLLENKSLTFFLISRASITIALQMVTIAVGWQMYSITNKPLYLGLVGLAQFLPMFLLTLVVGYVTDRFNRRIIVSLCQAFSAINFFLLAFESYTGGITKEKILIIVFFIGAINAFQGPAIQALLPNIVDKAIFPRAVALSSSVSQAATIIGPALGGILYTFGPAVVYSISGILSLISCTVMLLISIKQTKYEREPVNLKSIFAGISFIRTNPIILGAISLDLFAVLFGGATALLPVYASKILRTGPFGLGLLRSAPAIGALIMAALLARRPLKNNVGHIMFSAVIVFGLSTILFGISKNIVLSFMMFIILGSADVISVVIRSTLVQTATPDYMRGRVSSVNSLFVGTSNQLGEFESGIAAAYFGVVPAVVLGGIGTITIVILWIKLFPDLFNANKLIS